MFGRHNCLYFVLSVSIVGLASHNAVADTTRVVDLGPWPWVTSAWFDTTSNTAWVGGVNQQGVDAATMWSIDSTDAVIAHALTPLQPGEDGFVFAISRNGAYVGGYSDLGTIQQGYEGTVWTFGRWNSPQGTGGLPGYAIASEVRDISDFGKAGCLASGVPVTKDLGGRMQWLPPLPGGSGAGVVDAISASGSVCVGNAQDSAQNFVAVKWIAGQTVATPLEDPASLFGGATSISPNGTIIGGTIADEIGLWAAIWDENGLRELYEQSGARFQGIVYGIADDGFFAGNGAFGNPAILRGFVGHISWPYVITLEAWLQQYGHANPPAFEKVHDVYHDGTHYHFAAISVQTQGPDHGYYVQTPDVDVVVPGDTNGDGHVNVTDLLAVIASWGACPVPPPTCSADLNSDGTVNVTDLLLVISNWG